MFILYAVVIGMVIGLLTGGRPSRLGDLKLRWQAVMIGGLLVQVALFSDQVSSWIGAAGPPIYVASTVVTVIAVLRNRAIVGMPIVAYGAACNLAAIVANGGFMPASAGALGELGKLAPTAYSNSSVVASPELAPFTDQFALPAWMPFANVFSFGDVVIAIGVAFVIVIAMRRQTEAAQASSMAALVPVAAADSAPAAAEGAPLGVVHPRTDSNEPVEKYGRAMGGVPAAR